MATKKPFKETKVGSFLLQKLPKVFSAVANDSMPAKVIEALIGKSDLTPEDKQIALTKLEIEREELEGITRRWEADAASGNFLAASVRPAVLILLTISFIAGWAMQLQEIELVAEVVKLVYMGYFGSRGFEKVMGDRYHHKK